MRKCQNPDCDRMEGHGGECRRESPYARPVSDPSETLALIEEYRLTLEPVALGGWHAKATEYAGEWGPTIGDAVRACVQRIEAAGK